MNRFLTSLFSVALVASLATGASAKTTQCKDPKTGKFVKCVKPVATAAPKCRDKSGKFIKCKPSAMSGSHM